MSTWQEGLAKLGVLLRKLSHQVELWLEKGPPGDMEPKEWVKQHCGLRAHRLMLAQNMTHCNNLEGATEVISLKCLRL